MSKPIALLVLAKDWEIVQRDIGFSQQDCNYVEILKKNSSRIRIRIRSNSYQFQSHAIVEYWADGWKQIATLDPGVMRTPESLYVREREGGALEWFALDRNRLLQIALGVIE